MEAKELPENAPAVICIGSAVVDITAKPVGNENWQEKQRIESIKLGAGGDAVNQSLRLSEEGVRAAVLARVGRDENGRFLKKHLEERGVEASFLAEDSALSTGTALVLVNEAGERHTFSVNGAHAALCREDMEPLKELFSLPGNEVKAISLASLFSMPKLEEDGLLELLAEAKSRGLLVFADLAADKRKQGLDGIRSFLPFIDFFLPSDYDACRMTGKKTPEEAAKVFRDLGASHVIIKCGAEGAYIYDENGGSRVPAVPVKAVNTTGAGDAMSAFFISRILLGESLPEAAGYACREASRLVGGLR